MNARASLMPLLGLIATLAGAAAPAGAAPIAYQFAGEMTEFIPPVSDPDGPPPVPPDLRFFSGGFDYDPTAPGAAFSDFHMAFTGGPTLEVVPETEIRTEVGIFADLFIVNFGVRNLSVDGSFPDSMASFLLERPLTPQDIAGVLPPDLDGFIGSFVGVTFFGQIFVRGTLSEFGRETAVIPEPAAALLLASALPLWFAMRAMRRRQLA